MIGEKEYSRVVLHWSHLKSLELKGVHPLYKKIIDIEGMKMNYRLWTEIEKEIKNVDLEKYLEF